MTARGAEHLPALAGLRELDLRNLPLETESLAHVGKLTRLEVLRLPDVKGIRHGDGVRRGTSTSRTWPRTRDSRRSISAARP